MYGIFENYADVYGIFIYSHVWGICESLVLVQKTLSQTGLSRRIQLKIYFSKGKLYIKNEKKY